MAVPFQALIPTLPGTQARTCIRRRPGVSEAGQAGQKEERGAGTECNPMPHEVPLVMVSSDNPEHPISG